MIKRETRPAYHLMFAHAVCVLALTGLTLLFVPDVGAKNHDYCDRMFEELMFQDIPTSISSECKNRFQYNVNKIKRAHPLNSNF